MLIENVILLKGDVNYTTFHLENGRKKIVAHTIKFFENFLEAYGFLRVHRSFMINPSHVKEYNPQEFRLTMSDGHKAIISIRRKPLLKYLE